MTTTPSDEELKRIAADAVRPGMRLDHICWPVNAETHFRAIWEAGLAAGRAELQPKLDRAEANYRFMVERAADQKLDGYRELGQMACDNETRAMSAEQKLAALVEGLRALRGHLDDSDTIAAELDRLIQSAGPCAPPSSGTE